MNVKFFHVVFVHLVCNSELILASCGFPFLLRVVANLICIFLVSSQLDLLSALPELLHSFYDQKGCPRLYCRKLSSRLMFLFFYPLVLESKFQKNGLNNLRLFTLITTMALTFVLALYSIPASNVLSFYHRVKILRTETLKFSFLLQT
jgi:hypothetical protein